MATKQPSKPRKLTLKQRRFVEALPITPTLSDAVLAAGYDTPRANAHTIATENLHKLAVREAVKAQELAATNAAIATIVERKTWLSKVLRSVNLDEPQPVQAGLAASEQLNRMERVYGEPQPPSDTYNIQVLAGYSLEELDAILEAMRAKKANNGA